VHTEALISEHKRRSSFRPPPLSTVNNPQLATSCFLNNALHDCDSHHLLGSLLNNWLQPQTCSSQPFSKVSPSWLPLPWYARSPPLPNLQNSLNPFSPRFSLQTSQPAITLSLSPSLGILPSCWMLVEPGKAFSASWMEFRARTGLQSYLRLAPSQS
jgi:hypothetical protein